MGKPGTIATLESTVASENHAPGRPEMAAYPWGVLSGIVLGGGESPLHGEGPDGSTQPAKETRAGQVGSEHHGPTSLRGIGNRAKQSKDHRFQILNIGFQVFLVLRRRDSIHPAGGGLIQVVPAFP